MFDPAKRHTLSADAQHSNAAYTLYEGLECLGAPCLVMQRGDTIVEDTELKGPKGRGKFMQTKILKK
jgi:dihydropyrimidinase